MIRTLIEKIQKIDSSERLERSKVRLAKACMALEEKIERLSLSQLRKEEANSFEEIGKPYKVNQDILEELNKYMKTLTKMKEYYEGNSNKN